MEDANQSIDDIIDLLKDFSQLSSQNMVNFFTEDLWKQNLERVNNRLADELLLLSDEDLAKFPSGEVENGEGKAENTPLIATKKFRRLVKRNRLSSEMYSKEMSDPLSLVIGRDCCSGFERDGHAEHASNFGLNEEAGPLDAATLDYAGWVSKLINDDLTKRIMGKKKSHEVAYMAYACARMAHETKIKQVIDIGSGKGYLGQFLAKQYGLNVISVDSSETNTSGAILRSQRLSKQWKGIVKNLEQKTGAVIAEGLGQERTSTSSEISRKNLKTTTQASFSSMATTTLYSQPSPLSSASSSSSSSSTLTTEVTSSSSSSRTVASSSIAASSTSMKTPLSSTRTTSSSATRLALSLSPTSSSLSSSSLSQITMENNASGETPIDHLNHGKNPSVCASVTGYVDEETEVADILHSIPEADCFAVEEPFMMVGLHTCGDLAPSMLRIFTANPTMHCLVNVGCCYHHVTEEFASADEWDRDHSGVRLGKSYGFPMSSYLRRKKFGLGRGARMTACMSADRLAKESSIDVTVRGQFYRAVLQVILKDHFTLPTRKQIIGKLAPKCKTFLEYCRKALVKLKMDDSKISDAEIQAYEVKYLKLYRHLTAYNQMRAALAPSIEALIILDRLYYLREQPNIAAAYIARLFDPVTSPRCYALIAIKKSADH